MIVGKEKSQWTELILQPVVITDVIHIHLNSTMLRIYSGCAHTASEVKSMPIPVGVSIPKPSSPWTRDMTVTLSQSCLSHSCYKWNLLPISVCLFYLAPHVCTVHLLFIWVSSAFVFIIFHGTYTHVITYLSACSFLWSIWWTSWKPYIQIIYWCLFMYRW